MNEPFRNRCRVEFSHTDAAGIAHFSAFFDYMEQTEHAFWRSLGTSVVSRDEQGRISWPRVSASCDFRSPVRFEDELDVELLVARLGKRSATFRFTFHHEGRLVAEGELSVVCCRIRDGAPPEAIDIPDSIRSLFDAPAA